MELVKFSGLRAEMAKHGHKQKDVAEMLGIKVSLVSMRFSGKIKWTQPEIDILTKFYGKTYEELFQ